MSVKGASLCHSASGTQANRLTSMRNITSHDSRGKRVLQGLTMTIKFPSWEMTQVTSSHSTLAIASPMTLNNWTQL